MSFTPENMTGGDALARQLVLEGVDQMFGVPGIQLDWAVDGIAKLNGAIAYKHMRHEQAASYAADGYARSTGRPGVCMVVPGPGLFNAMAGLSTAYSASSPVVCIVGQIATNAIGKGYGVLHEVPDQSRALDTVTKWHAMARRPEEIPGLVREAFRQVMHTRPRPVALEIPPDVLQAKADIRLCEPAEDPDMRLAPNRDDIEQTAALLRDALKRGGRIGIYAGWGVTTADAQDALRAFVDRTQALVMHSSNGRGGLSDRHPLALPGMAGRAVFPNCEVVLVIGSRMMDSGARPTFSKFGDARVIHINSDANDMTAPRTPHVAMHADARLALEAMTEALHDAPVPASRAQEAAELRAWTETQYRDVQPQHGFVCAIRNALPDDGFVVGEMTQISYVARTAMPVYRARGFITPGYQGTLGFGYGTALGVQAANPGKAVVSINGDGGFMFGIQELASAKAHNWPVVGLVFNDKAFGNVKRLQQMQFGRTLGSDLENPDFVKVAEAFGIQAQRVQDAPALQAAITAALDSKKPALIEIPVGEMPSPMHLVNDGATPPRPVPMNPLVK